MRITRDMKWIAMVIAALFTGVVFVACSADDNATATTPSLASADPAVAGLADVRQHGSDDDGSNNDVGDDVGDDVSDDDSDDDDSDDSSDDDSDDDGSGGSSGSDEDEARVRGLFFGIESCPATVSGCVAAVRIKDTLVIVTNETRVDNEPLRIEGLPASDVPGLLGDHLGLPLRARGVSVGGGLVASDLRIDDEIIATGTVLTPATGCEVSLLVRGTIPLCYSLAPGVGAPTVGSDVRIEGVVVDLVSPYRATRIERSGI